MKTCSACRATKEDDLFVRWRSTLCKACDSARGLRRYYADHEKSKERTRLKARAARAADGYMAPPRNPAKATVTQRASKLRGYGVRVSTKTVREMLESAAGKCACCGLAEAKMCLDHCHETLTLRGVLCNGCNSALGMLREDPERIKKLLAYAESVCEPIKARPPLKLVK